MGDLNAVYGTEQSDPVTLTASESDTELVEEPKYVSLDDLTSRITMPDESQYHVVTKIGYSAKAQVCSFYLHGGEATPVQVGPKVAAPANSSDVVDVHIRFPMGAPVKMASQVTPGGELNVWVEYHTVQTQNRIPTKQDYATA